MKKNFCVFLLFGLGMMGPTAYPADMRSVDDQVKNLAQCYTQIEAQLDRSVHYLKKEGTPETTIEQAWFNGAGDLIKFATEHSDASGREVTEYFAHDFDNAYNGMFLLTRKESPLLDGGVRVDESRKYFGSNKTDNGELIRESRKSALFKVGESLDTVHVPNVVVDLAKQPKDNRSEEEQSKAQQELFSKPQEIAAALRKTGPPDVDPFANDKGDSKKFRVIQGTASPDGRYAIALGLARAEINWDDFVEKEADTERSTYYTENEEDTRNYVVDLVSQRILGETGCNYFGTRRRYNHRECSVSWSPDSATFVQLWSDKWNYTACNAGHIAPGPKLAAVVDLGKEVDKKTFTFLKKRQDPDSGESLSMSVDQVGNDGVIQINVYSEEASGENKGGTRFSLSERLRLRETSSGPRVETVNIRRLRVEE
jgi:hypothetical protein